MRVPHAVQRELHRLAAIVEDALVEGRKQVFRIADDPLNVSLR